jgi:hypothetical protein
VNGTGTPSGGDSAASHKQIFSLFTQGSARRAGLKAAIPLGLKNQ